MTRLNKPIRRVSDSPVREAGKLRPLVVTIYPNGTIGLRPSKTRREEIITLEAAWSLGVKQRVAREQAIQRAAKAAKRKEVR